MRILLPIRGIRWMRSNWRRLWLIGGILRIIIGYIRLGRGMELVGGKYIMGNQ